MPHSQYSNQSVRYQNLVYKKKKKKVKRTVLLSDSTTNLRTNGKSNAQDQKDKVKDGTVILRCTQDPMLAMHAVFQNQNIAAACNPRFGTSNGVSSFHIVYLLP